MARANEDKFKKMKGIYTQLREEHVALLRKGADVKKQLDTEKRSKTEMDTKHKVRLMMMMTCRIVEGVCHMTSPTHSPTHSGLNCYIVHVLVFVDVIDTYKFVFVGLTAMHLLK